MRDQGSSRVQVVRCPAVLYNDAISLRRLDRKTLEKLADDVLLWSLNIDLGARGDTLARQRRAKETGLL